MFPPTKLSVSNEILDDEILDDEIADDEILDDKIFKGVLILDHGIDVIIWSPETLCKWWCCQTDVIIWSTGPAIV